MRNIGDCLRRYLPLFCCVAQRATLAERSVGIIGEIKYLFVSLIYIVNDMGYWIRGKIYLNYNNMRLLHMFFVCFKIVSNMHK